MGRSIEYFFTLQSPWTYLGNAAFVAVAAKHGVHINYRPVKLGEVFAESGGLPLGKRHPVRQRYRIVELQRWIEKRGLPMKLHPKFWPVNAGLADRAVIAALASGAPVDALVARLLASVFEHEEDIADEALLAAVLKETGFDAESILTAAKSEASDKAYSENVALALELHAMGAPVYALDGEVFWGQDRIVLLDDALTSGRAPFSAEA